MKDRWTRCPLNLLVTIRVCDPKGNLQWHERVYHLLKRESCWKKFIFSNVKVKKSELHTLSSKIGGRKLFSRSARALLSSQWWFARGSHVIVLKVLDKEMTKAPVSYCRDFTQNFLLIILAILLDNSLWENDIKCLTQLPWSTLNVKSSVSLNWDTWRKMPF